MIRGENLKKTFSDQLVFEDVSFVIPDGEIVGFYGSSGIGKSTLAKVLCGIKKPDEGAVYLDDELLYSANMPYDRKKGLQIQMVYQQPYASLDHSQKLIKGFYELIRYHHFAANKSEADRLIRELMDEVGLNMEILNHLPHQISGGEAQRVKLATELSRVSTGRTIYILDEPTTGLHAADVHKLLEVLQQLVDAGNTVLVIEHNLDVIKSADHIIDLGPEGGDMGGCVVACGTPEEVAQCEQSYTGKYLKRYL